MLQALVKNVVVRPLANVCCFLTQAKASGVMFGVLVALTISAFKLLMLVWRFAVSRVLLDVIWAFSVVYSLVALKYLLSAKDLSCAKVGW